MSDYYSDAPYLYDFAFTLKKFRTAKGLTQEQLGEAIGLTSSAITMYETGARTPSLRILLKLSNFFDVSINDLLNNPMKSKSVDEAFLNITFDEFNSLSATQKQSIVNFIEFIKQQK